MGRRSSAHSRYFAVTVSATASGKNSSTSCPVTCSSRVLEMRNAVGFQVILSRRGVAVRHLEVSLRARSGNLLVFLGAEDEGNPGLEGIEGTVWVDADLDAAGLREAWDEAVRRSPVAQTLLRGSRPSFTVKTA